MMKYILVIGDGCADNPVPELGGKTPLQHASIPHIDAMASAGIIGNVKNCPSMFPPGSDTAILSIFGCDPTVCYSGRAPIEAAASGIKLNPGDAAYRCNMVAYEDGDLPLMERKILSHSAGSIDGESSVALMKALYADPTFAAAAEKAGMIVHPALSFRHIAVQSAVDNTGIKLIPPHDHLGEVIEPLMPSGCANADVLKELMVLAHEVLEKHPINEQRRAEGKLPANGIWFWAEGTAVELPNFVETYKKTGGVVSAVPLCHGIAALVGLDMITVEGATGELETNYEGKMEATFEALKTSDFVACHLEAPDECTHNGDLPGKLQSIEWLDSRIVAPLLEKLNATDWDYRLLLLSDHKTLTATRGHDADPVPFLIYDSRKDNKTGYTYCEADGEKGITVEAGVELMGMLFAE